MINWCFSDVQMEVKSKEELVNQLQKVMEQKEKEEKDMMMEKVVWKMMKKDLETKV